MTTDNTETNQPTTHANLLSKVRVVLVNTSHQGNIGSTARAMKTMGLTDLVLVDPVEAPQSHAAALAAGATDILANARVVDTLQEAIADCQLVLATSARSRTLDWPMLSPRQASEKVIQEATAGTVALVFGRENSGLTNEELQQSQFHVHIPANPDYSSLNLAMAVQTLSYEVRCAWLQAAEQASNEEQPDYPKADDLERFYTHLEQTLMDAGFIVRQHPGQVMNKLRRLFNRARPERNELNILRGILAAFDKAVGKHR